MRVVEVVLLNCLVDVDTFSVCEYADLVACEREHDKEQEQAAQGAHFSLSGIFFLIYDQGVLFSKLIILLQHLAQIASLGFLNAFHFL